MKALFLATQTAGLCLDPPFGSFVERLTSSVQIEASQIDFWSFQLEPLLCDSTEGPLCRLLHPDADERVFGSTDLFSRTLGIPDQISVAINGHPGPKPEVEQLVIFSDFRLHVQSDFACSWDFRLGPVEVEFQGPGWVMTESGVLGNGAASSAILFAEPVVVQNLNVVPGEGPLLLVGKLKGKEQWRRELRGDGVASLVGSQVFARWRGNGAVYRAKVMFDEDELGVTVSWMDGDSSFRHVAKEDVVSVVPGRSENLHAIDQIEIIQLGNRGLFVLEDLVVAVGGNMGVVKVIRSGGGMVFEELVSAGAVMYSVDDLIRQKWRIKNSIETRKDFAAYFTGKRDALAEYRSFRNVVLLWQFVTGTHPILNPILSNMTSEQVGQFQNINDLVNALIDRNPNSYGLMGEFQTWLRHHRQSDGHTSSIGGISTGDSYEGALHCVGFSSVPLMFRFQILGFAQVRENLVSVSVQLRFGQAAPTAITAEFVPSIGLLHIPTNDAWTYPLSLSMFRTDYFSIELLGTVDKVGCGALLMTPIELAQATKDAFKENGVRNVSELKSAFFKFNNLLIKSSRIRREG